MLLPPGRLRGRPDRRRSRRGKEPPPARGHGAAHKAGFCVAIGFSVEFGEEIWPLAPLREMVASVANDLDSEAFDLVVGNARAVLARLAPEVGVTRFPTRGQTHRSRAPDCVSSSSACFAVSPGAGRYMACRRRSALCRPPRPRTLFSLLALAQRSLARHCRSAPIGPMSSTDAHLTAAGPGGDHPQRGDSERLELRTLDRAGTRGRHRLDRRGCRHRRQSHGRHISAERRQPVLRRRARRASCRVCDRIS